MVIFMLPIQFRKKVFILFLLMLFCVLSANSTLAQSTNSEYPTPVTGNEVTGKIEPRDVGDPRLTRHFFTLNGTNGDLNITIESENLNGDVDVFTINGLRPLTKVSLFDTGSKFVTTASIYMRKRESLMLRVEARTASDNAGNYRITFSGGFEPIANVGPRPPVEPKVNIPKSKEGTVRVNAVGARIEEPKPPVVEKPVPSKVETTVAKNEEKTKPAKTTPSRTNTTKTNTTARSRTTTQPANTSTSNTNASSANTPSTAKKKEDPIKAEEERRKKAAEARAEARAEAERKRKEEAAKIAEKRKTRQETAEQPRETVAKAETNKARKSSVKPKSNSENNSSTAASTPPPDPMASVRLVVETKDGERIERRMNEVRRVNVEKGILIVVFVDGKIERIPMTNVLKMAIEPL